MAERSNAIARAESKRRLSQGVLTKKGWKYEGGVPSSQETSGLEGPERRRATGMHERTTPGSLTSKAHLGGVA